MEDKVNPNEIEKFIKSHKIKTRSELQNNYLSVCQKFWKLSEEEKDRILPRMYDYSSLQDKNDFVNFIQANKIESRNQFDETYPGIYNKFKSLLTEEEQNKILPPKVPSYKNLITVEDFDTFVLENHIKSRKDFGNRFYGAYMRFLSLPKEEQDKITFEIDITMHHVDWVLNNVDDFRKFIKDKKIKSKKDLQKNYNWAYHRFYSILTEEERNSITFDSGNRNLRNMNSISDFQKFIDENHISSYTEFTKNYSSVYKKFCETIGSCEKDKLNFTNTVVDKESIEYWRNIISENNIKSRKVFRENYPSKYIHYLKARETWKDNEDIEFEEKGRDDMPKCSFSTIKEFQDFIDSENILSLSELNNKYPHILRRFYRVIPKDKRKDLKFKIETKEIVKFGDSFSKLEDFQNFIIENSISKPTDFQKRFMNIYTRMLRVLSEDSRNNLRYTENTYGCHSSGEIYLINLFNKNNIKFILEKTYPDLKDKTYLRFDFYLPDYNILVEYHGQQHFNKRCKYFSENLIENDHRKYEYAISNNINILYFSLDVPDYNKFGYFTEVITDPEILINKIKEIGMTNQPQQ